MPFDRVGKAPTRRDAVAEEGHVERKSRKQLRKVLMKLLERERFVTLDRRPLDPFDLEGFVVGVSDRLVMLHVVHGNSLEFNGYAVVRMKDLQSVSTSRSFIPRALKLLARKPVRPVGLDLTNWATLLATAAEQYPLVWLELEQQRPGCGYVGRFNKLTRKAVHLRDVDPQGRWGDREQYPLRRITQVTLGDGYARALWAVLEHDALRAG